MLHSAWFITELFGCASKIQTTLLEAKWTRQVKIKKRNEGDTSISGCKEHGLVMGLGSSGWI